MKKKGFTLIEVLVSATIIAVLTAMGVISYSSVNKRSRDTKRKSDLEQVRSALEMFRADNTASPGEYSSTGNGSFVSVSGLSSDLVAGGYLPVIPADPDSDNSYWYRAIAPDGTHYTSYCLCGELETLRSSQGTCTVRLPAQCNYGLKSP